MRDAADDLMSDRVVLERFQGFTDGALGGYAAGVAARRIGGRRRRTAGRFRRSIAS
jgi:hypothetical protein